MITTLVDDTFDEINSVADALDEAEQAIFDEIQRANPSSDPDRRRFIRRSIALCLAITYVPRLLPAASRLANWSVISGSSPGSLDIFGAAGFLKNAAGDTRHICELLPIYMPGERTSANGGPLNFTTNHIRQALGYPGSAIEVSLNGQRTSFANGDLDYRLWSVGVRTNPSWVLLDRATGGAAAATGRRTWYNSVQPCSDRAAATSAGVLPAGSICDEFPFYSTAQGGPLPLSPASLKFVPGDNDSDPDSNTEGPAQGGDLGGFLRACNVEDEDAYLVFPIFDYRPFYNTVQRVTKDDPIIVDPGFPLPAVLAEAFRSERYCPAR